MLDDPKLTQVAQSQELVMMIQIPSLAPIKSTVFSFQSPVFTRFVRNRLVRTQFWNFSSS